VSDVTVSVTSLPGREILLDRLVQSIDQQTYPVELVINRGIPANGPAANRNMAFDQVDTEYVAFVDDDDAFLPEHIERLRWFIEYRSADLVYPWYHVVGGPDPLPWFGLMFDPLAIRTANYIPVTVLARTEVVRAVGGFENKPDGDRPFEDWYLWLKMLDNGADFVHLPERTWVWFRDHPGSVT
jgi:glycosyltransferase involved in cell wall biosynthesis